MTRLSWASLFNTSQWERLDDTLSTALFFFSFLSHSSESFAFGELGSSKRAGLIWPQCDRNKLRASFQTRGHAHSHLFLCVFSTVCTSEARQISLFFLATRKLFEQLVSFWILTPRHLRRERESSWILTSCQLHNYDHLRRERSWILHSVNRPGHIIRRDRERQRHTQRQRHTESSWILTFRRPHWVTYEERDRERERDRDRKREILDFNIPSTGQGHIRTITWTGQTASDSSLTEDCENSPSERVTDCLDGSLAEWVTGWSTYLLIDSVGRATKHKTKHPAQRELTHFLPGDLFPVLPKNGIISMDTDTTDYGCLLTANKVGFVVVCLFVVVVVVFVFILLFVLHNLHISLMIS